MGLAAVILAAGKGTRMKSNLPKVLHTVCGVSMLLHVLEAVSKAGAERVVVVAGFGRDLVAQEVQGKAEVVYQQEQLGTAHALLQARCLLDGYKGDIMGIPQALKCLWNGDY